MTVGDIDTVDELGIREGRSKLMGDLTKGIIGKPVHGSKYNVAKDG